jgi:glycine/D-amino acid oxidase-like deaminating enzyme
MSGASPDVVVIGGGIVGTSAALFLAEAGASVVLLETQVVAAAASGRNAGSIQHPLDRVRAPLYEESLSIHQRFGILGDRPAGLLAVGAEAPGPVAAIEAAAPFRDLHTQLVDGAALRELEPELAEGLTGCLISGTGFPAHPAAATRRFAEAAREAGARIEEGVGAEPEVVGGHCVGARGDDGALRPAGAVLVAAGPWSSALLNPSGAWQPVSALWGVTVQIALPVGHAVRHRIEEWDDAGTDGELAAGVQFEATPLDDVTVLGATRAATAPDEPRVAEAVRARAAQFLPIVASASVTAVRACARPVTDDGRPLLGPVPGIEGLHVAAGHGPYGISLGPASGRIAADAILDRAAVPAAFRADRAAIRPPHA